MWTSQAFASPAVESKTAYDVRVAAPVEPSQVCTVAGGRGTVVHADVTTVSVVCHAVRKQVSAA